MCNKNTPPKLKSKSMIKINKRNRTTVSLKPSRKIRTKTRKPKFLSLLRLDSSPETSQQSGEMTHDNDHHHHQLNLFPLHPENLVEDKDLHDENNMAYLFSTSDDTTATTLTGLLDSKTETVISSEEDSVSPPSLTYAYGGGQDSEEAAGGAVSLVRTALRNRERDASEEKWVCYSEVVEEKKKKKKVEEEVSSCFADARDYSVRTQQRHRLSLKLDYQEILNAWCDKGPLYVEGECPQTVPDLHHDQFLRHHSGSNVLMDGLWRVPENSKIVSMEEEMNGGRGDHGGWKIGQREASVLRYKEKRQSRLFSKRIRYEVRKVNAEKRPRMKGRFVKRS